MKWKKAYSTKEGRIVMQPIDSLARVGNVIFTVSKPEAKRDQEWFSELLNMPLL